MKMDKYEVLTFDDKEIVLRNSGELESLYNNLENAENFILTWEEDKKTHSEVIIASNFSIKVKNGELKLRSERQI
jgi:hypothetical protein